MEEKSTLSNHPTRILGLHVTPAQQICFSFLVPIVFNCLVYILDFAFSIAVIQQHFKEGNVIWAVLTLLIMYIPAIVFFILIVSKPDLWDEQCGESRATLWFFTRLTNIVIFPVWGIFRYSKQLFWSLEALMSKGQLREDALLWASQPSRIELYLFLQPFLQGAPQAMLQLYVLFVQHQDHADTGPMQVLCITSSLMTLAIAVVSFQRFESQKLLGRREPWVVQNINGKLPGEKKDHSIPKEGNTTENIQEISKSELQHTTQQTRDNVNVEEEGSETPFLQPRGVPHSTQQELTDNQEDNQSNVSSPNTLDILKRMSLPQGSPPQPPKCTSRLQDSDKQIETNGHPSPTPPKPDNVLQILQRQVNNEWKITPPRSPPPSPPKPDNIPESSNEQIHTEYSCEMSPPSYAPPTPPKSTNIVYTPVPAPKYMFPSSLTNSVRMPEGMISPMSDREGVHTRELQLPSRRMKVKGLQQDDLVGKSVAFLGWFFFLLSRTLAIAACSYFLPWLALATCALHYVVTVGYLLYRRHCPSFYKVCLQFYLGYIFLFCLIEFKAKFTRAIIVHIFYFVSVALQNLIISTAWYKFSEWDGWWYNYTYFLILGALITSSLSMGMYFYILKPHSQILYEDELQITR